MDFFNKWKHESNPWKECYREGAGIFEKQFCIYFIFFTLTYIIGYGIKRNHDAAVKANPSSPPDPRSISSLIASRPTVIAGTVHSIATAIISCGILYQHYKNDKAWIVNGTDLIQIWQTVGLPLSLSYFFADCFFYCLPKKDVIIFVHHVIMCFCHYPVGHNAGAILAGAGDISWVTWLSIVGYTSEVSTAVMNYRWYLLNTLEEDWIGFGIVNVFVTSSWAGRVVMFSYLLIAEIFPRAHMYLEKKQILTFAVMVFGHFGIGLLSLYWCMIMCRGGIKSLFVFKRKSSQGGSDKKTGFAESVGLNNADSPTRESIPKKIIHEADAYVDGTLYNGNGNVVNGNGTKKSQ
ncbi:hypothetical protein ACHAWO_013548 [Cyclotella atomus]|uniref:TLC domain-containing protein n=1 Tax=Cyclotella atomus TaxID=382360 RepID=A0ABD3PSN8_9STRA